MTNALDPATVERLTEAGFLAVMNANDRELALPLSAWAERNLLKRRIKVAIAEVIVSNTSLAQDAPAQDALREDDVYELLIKTAAPFAKNRGSSGIKAWCLANNVNSGHASEFINRRRGPTNDLLTALGLTRCYSRSGDQ